MNTVQTAIASVLILAFIAALPGLYIYTEIEPSTNGNEQPPQTPGQLETPDAEVPPIPDASELPETDFELRELTERELQQVKMSMQININTAGKDQLTEISGVGPATAENIINHREQYGYFSRPDDLQDISGIGPATVRNMKNDIKFSD